MTKSDPNSIWLYNPTFALAIVFAILYAIPMTIQFLQTVIIYKSYYFIVVLVGVCLEVGGYAARAASIKQPDKIVCTRPYETNPTSCSSILTSRFSLCSHHMPFRAPS
jgi:hypothetical protein